MGSLFLSALFPTTAQAHAAAEMLERRGDILLAIETESGPAPQPVRELNAWSEWTSFTVSAACALLLDLATIRAPGVIPRLLDRLEKRALIWCCRKPGIDEWYCHGLRRRGSSSSPGWINRCGRPTTANCSTGRECLRTLAELLRDSRSQVA